MGALAGPQSLPQAQEACRLPHCHRRARAAAARLARAQPGCHISHRVPETPSRAQDAQVSLSGPAAARAQAFRMPGFEDSVSGAVL